MYNTILEITKAHEALSVHLPESIRPILLQELRRIADTARAEQAKLEHERRLSDTRYNGWSNRETWLVGLWWNECPIERVEADDKEEAIHILAEQLEELFSECSQIPSSGLESDLFQGAAARIDWYEIAEHWIDDIELVLPEAEEAEEANN